MRSSDGDYDWHGEEEVLGFQCADFWLAPIGSRIDATPTRDLVRQVSVAGTRAEPVARANADSWHVGCGAAFGASCRRGSSVTFGKKKPLMTNPRWFQLLEGQKDLRSKYGLTVPFLVGAVLVQPRDKKKVVPTDSKAAIRELFASMLDGMPSGWAVYISRCQQPELKKQPIVALHRFDDPLPNGVRSPVQGRVTIFAEDGFVPKSEYSFQSLTERFVSDFHADAAAGNFSFIGGAYTWFSDEDFSLIEDSRSL